MNREEIAKYIKVAAAILPLIGYTITPDQQEALNTAFVAIYGIVSALEGFFFKRG